MGDCDNNFNQTQTQTHANFHNHTHTHRCARPLVITTLENAASASAAVAVAVAVVAAERWLCPSVGTVENGQIVTVDRIALFFLFLLLKVHTPPPLPVALLRRISQGKHTLENLNWKNQNTSQRHEQQQQRLWQWQRRPLAAADIVVRIEMRQRSVNLLAL